MKLRRYQQFALLAALLAAPMASSAQLKLSCTEEPHAAVNGPPSIVDRKVFGIRLRRQVSNLLKEVENYYGKQVREVRFESSDPWYVAESWIETDGTPVICFGKTVEPSEEVIVHELFHLKLETLGFPGPIYWDIQKELADESNQAVLTSLNHTIMQEILHRLFYADMRKMSFDPDHHDRIKVREVMEGKEPMPALGVDALARFYFKFTLNVHDAKLVASIDKWYENNKWIEGLQKGRTLVRIVQESNPKTPDDLITAFLRCIETVSPPEVKYSFLRWQSDVAGHDMPRGAVIAVRLAPRMAP